MACNGIGTPRLLLNSRSAAFPDGLANRSGLVGKNLMFHPFASVAGIFAEQLDSYEGPIGSLLFSHEFYETDPARNFVRGFALQAVRQSGPLNTALGGFAAQRVPWGEQHHSEFARRSSRMINLGVMGEDLPESVNEVLLDPRAHRQRRDSGAARALPPERQQQAHAGLWRGASGRGSRSGGCDGGALGESVPRLGLASAGHVPDGRSSPTGRSWIAGAARTTCPTCSSSTAACSSPARR